MMKTYWVAFATPDHGLRLRTGVITTESIRTVADVRRLAAVLTEQVDSDETVTIVSWQEVQT